MLKGNNKNKAPINKIAINKKMPTKAEMQKNLQVYQQLLGTATSRLNYFSNLGLSYGGDRNLYTALGYPDEIKYVDYYAKYKRQDISKAVINRPIEATWKGEQLVFEKGIEPEKDELLKKWKDLYKTLKLKQGFIRLDKLSSIGQFGVLLLGFNDVTGAEQWQKGVNPSQALKLMYVSPYSENATTIFMWDSTVTSPRYGKPLLYQIEITLDDGKSSMLTVHHSRIIHVAGTQLESEIYGEPELMGIYNRLMDLEKIVGGSAEMFWRGARSGYAAEVKDGYEADANLKTSLEDQMDAYSNNLTRFFVNEGVDLKNLAPQVSSPSEHVDVQISMISAAKGIPKRILMGSERGELSSAQDADAWKELVETRRQEYADVMILREFVNRMMEFKVLPLVKDYMTEWTALTNVSDKDKAEIGKIKATALKEYAASPLAASIFPPEMFYKLILHMTDEEVEELNMHLENYLSEMEVEEPTAEELAQLEKDEEEANK